MLLPSSFLFYFSPGFIFILFRVLFNFHQYFLLPSSIFLLPFNILLLPFSFCLTSFVLLRFTSPLYLFFPVILKYFPTASQQKIPVISPNFLVWTFCGRAQFPHSCGRIPRNYAETMPFHKISTSEN